MGDRPRKFWASAFFSAIVVAGVLAVGTRMLLRLEPRVGIRLLGAAELWLLAVFTVGILGVLIGCSVAFGGWFRGSRLRADLDRWKEKAAALDSADDRTMRMMKDERGSPAGDHPVDDTEIDPAWWTMAVGAQLLVIYTVGWWILG